MAPRLSSAEIFMNLLNEPEPTVWIDAEIKNFMKVDGFTFSQMQHDLAILAEEWANKKLQIPQQGDRRRTSFFPTNSPDQPHDRRQRQSTFQFAQSTSFQAEKDNQNPPANSQGNATDENLYAIGAGAGAGADASATFQQSFPPNSFSPFQPTGSTYIPGSVAVFPPSGYAKEIANLEKMYKDEMKYAGSNDHFGHKLSIFHLLCSKADIFFEARSKAFFSMLRGFAFDYYLANVNMLQYATFDQLCSFISNHFEKPNNARNNLIK